MMKQNILNGLALKSMVLAGALSLAAPAAASTIVSGRCDSLTDNDAQGCVFSGNISGNANADNQNSFLSTQAAYNAAFDPDIKLTFLTTLEGFGGKQKSGTFDFSKQFAGRTIDYVAVKGGNEFILLQNVGGRLKGSFSTAGLFNGGGNQPAISHVSFFESGAVSAVPEPATWAFMLVGFGAVGHSMRKRPRARLAYSV